MIVLRARASVSVCQCASVYVLQVNSVFSDIRPTMQPLFVLVSVLFLPYCLLVDPPEFIERPRDQRVPASEVAAFFCRARGDPAPVISWLHGGQPFEPALSVKLAGGGRGFWLQPVRATTDEGNYECVAENKVGDPERASATLTVIPGGTGDRPAGFPSIERQPSARSVERGHHFSLVCRARGDPAPLISWYKDGVPVNFSDPRFHMLDDAKKGDLLVKHPTEVDQGKYRCGAENALGTIYSHEASVYVRVRRVPPVFTLPPKPVYEILPGDDVNVTCVASGSPVPKIRWRKEPDVELTPADSLPFGRAFLVLADVRQSNNYTCVAESHLDTITTTTLIRVQERPDAPTNLSVSAVTSDSAQLSWTFDNNKQHTIQYYVIQYNRVHGVQQEEISGVISLHYVVLSLSPSTEYQFRVIAVNNIGRGEPSAPLLVTTKPSEPGSAPKLVEVRPLSSTTLIVKWSPPEHPNGVITNYRVYYTTDWSLALRHWSSEAVNAGSSTLTIVSGLLPHHVYAFRVQAETQAGGGPLSQPMRAKTQQGVPSQPSELRVQYAGATSANITWTKPSYPGDSILHYNVYVNDSFTKDVRKEVVRHTSQSYTVDQLYPNTEYWLWLAAASSMGEGASTPAVSFLTEEYVPGGPPLNISVTPLDSRTLRVTWQPPATELQHGRITYYKLMYVPRGRRHHHATQLTIRQPDARNFTLDELAKYTEYEVWMSAGTSVGDGPSSHPVLARTDEDVPGKPLSLTALVINSTSILANWKPPDALKRNGRILGYHVYVFELNSQGEERDSGSRRHEVRGSETTSYNITDLQPSTSYLLRVAALTRKGDGARSDAARVSTPGGVPSRPRVVIKVLNEAAHVSVDVEWSRPTETHGELIGYRVRYGRVSDPSFRQVIIDDVSVQHRRLSSLERGVEYEFRVSGRNAVGHGQEEIVRYKTSEAAPSAPPGNVSFRYQTSDRVALTWDAPLTQHRNGRIVGYNVRFQRLDNVDHVESRDTNITKVVFDGLEAGSVYSFSVRALTAAGAGPWSQPAQQLRTDPDMVRPPIHLRAMATGHNSVEVWWDQVHTAAQIVGYQVFYSMTAAVDLDVWSFKAVPITTSAELDNLDKLAQYSVMVAARSKTGLGRLSEPILVRVKPIDVPSSLRARDVTTHSMTLTWGVPVQLNPRSYRVRYDAVKEFLDAEGVTQTQRLPARTVNVDPSRCDFGAAAADACRHVIDELAPFTTYTVNVTAVPYDDEYRPPAKLRVTTQMAAPQPLVKPAVLGVRHEKQVVVILPRASEEFGPVSHYYIIVVPDDKNNPPKNPDFYRTSVLVAKKSSKSSLLHRPYIAARFYQRDIPYTLALGDGQDYDGFTNRLLDPQRKYRMFVRAVVDTPGRHLYTSSPYSAALGLHMRRLPADQPLPQRPAPGQPYDRRGQMQRQATNGGVGSVAGMPLVAWVLVPLVLALLLAVVLAVYVVVGRRKKREYLKSACGGVGGEATMMKPLMGGSAVTATIIPASSSLCRQQQQQCHSSPTPPAAAGSSVFSGSLRRRHVPSAMSAAVAGGQHVPLHVSQLGQHVEMLKQDDCRLFSQEYESIEPGQQFTWLHSSMECNKSKNRYANVIAYDHSRVILQPIDGVAGSDYINANFCDGYRKRNAYIATQGPLVDTMADFWRMVWEQHSCTIVMMTRLEERARIKCDQYWPARGTLNYGGISVTLTDLQQLATYTVRTFLLHKNVSGEQREVLQLQFTAWPDHGVPDHPTPFLMFLRRVRAVNPADAGPIITHCSAGVGRTGCFIVIDSMLERINVEASVDVYGHVTCLRSQRNYMVQTEDQYVFIHDALLESVTAGNTEVPLHQLQLHVARLLRPAGMHTSDDTGSQTLSDSTTGMELEFKKLSTLKAQPYRFVSANLPVNKLKNRFVNILPFESSRVCLQAVCAVEGSDYINANYIDGYRQRDAYIATQGPLPETVEDFWRMLWEHNSTIVVMLTKLNEMGRDKCHQYWPSDKATRYAYCVVEPISDFNMNNCTMREFKVTDTRDASLRTVRQFQYTDWPEQGVPHSGESFVDFIGHVHKTKVQFGLQGPITVHCSAGVGRTGAFIALSSSLERLQYESVVDIFNTVRVLRTQRPAMVQTEEEYRFIYQAIIMYIEALDCISA